MDVLNKLLVQVLIMKQDVLIWRMVQNAFGLDNNVWKKAVQTIRQLLLKLNVKHFLKNVYSTYQQILDV